MSHIFDKRKDVAAFNPFRAYVIKDNLVGRRNSMNTDKNIR